MHAWSDCCGRGADARLWIGSTPKGPAVPEGRARARNPFGGSMTTGNSSACRASAAIVLSFGLCGAPLVAAAQESDWIGVWSASPQADWGADFFAPVGIPRSLRDQTIRQVARISLGGEKVRVEVLERVRQRADDDWRGDTRASPGLTEPSIRQRFKALTFGGKLGATIPPGAPIWSDPVDLECQGARQPRGQPLPVASSRRPRPGTTMAARRPGSGRAIKPPPKASRRSHHELPHFPERYHGRRQAGRAGGRALRRFDYRWR